MLKNLTDIDLIVSFGFLVFPFLCSEWIGAGSWAVSMLAASFVVALCRKKSTRLMAVIGGLVLALGILFTSFATMFHQVAISYCKSGDV